jgi:SagB-type dehydrogenase family enzyme
MSGNFTTLEATAMSDPKNSLNLDCCLAISMGRLHMVHRSVGLGIINVLLLAGLSLAVAQNVKSIQFPPPQTEIGKPLMQALKLRQSSRNFDTRPLPMQELSNLLWAADGINRPESGKRTAPTAKNWQELDVYVVLPEGVYVYDATAHSLNPVVVGDLREATGSQVFVKNAPLTLVYVSDYGRMPMSSNEEKELYGATDAAFIAQNVYLYCASQGLAVVVRGGINRSALAKLMKLRDDQKIILAQTVGYPK